MCSLVLAGVEAVQLAVAVFQGTVVVDEVFWQPSFGSIHAY
jgi:hypothetical protein